MAEGEGKGKEPGRRVTHLSGMQGRLRATCCTATLDTRHSNENDSAKLGARARATLRFQEEEGRRTFYVPVWSDGS